MKVRVVVPGDVLTRTRERLKWSVEEMADYLQVEPHVLAGLEKGHRDLSRWQWKAFDERLEKLCEEYPVVYDDEKDGA